MSTVSDSALEDEWLRYLTITFAQALVLCADSCRVLSQTVVQPAAGSNSNDGAADDGDGGQRHLPSAAITVKDGLHKDGSAAALAAAGCATADVKLIGLAEFLHILHVTGEPNDHHSEVYITYVFVMSSPETTSLATSLAWAAVDDDRLEPSAARVLRSVIDGYVYPVELVTEFAGSEPPPPQASATPKPLWPWIVKAAVDQMPAHSPSSVCRRRQRPAVNIH